MDFLRAASITVVVLGHWLMAAAYLQGSRLRLESLLELAPWTQWLTWAFQVMPLFFLVGGYANAASWEAARRAGQGYGLWTATRLKRLVSPVVPLLIVWSAMAMIAHRLGVHPQMIKVGSQAALIPTWFLAVYVMVVVAAPAAHWAWRRFGMASFWVLALGAVVVDGVAFASGFGLLRWVNYAFVWLGVHQLGYVWRAGRIVGPARALAWAAGGLGLLVFLVVVASYPVSMITVPGAEVSNSRPPTLALLALGVFHGGLLLAVQAPVRGWLGRLRPWTATVLVNGTIMTLYLWHVTVMVLIIGLLNLSGGAGLGLEPGTWSWWASRPIWIAILAVVLSIFLAIFGRFEQTARRGAVASLPAWRVIAGAIGVSTGLAVLALKGIGAEGLSGIRIGTVTMALVGAALLLGPRTRRSAPA
ncbi:MAG: acyltransferase family protein [Gemmatimonadota bacterium]